MIKNEKQYKITRKKFSELRDERTRMEGQGEKLPASGKLILASLIYFLEGMEKEIVAYEQLVTSKSIILKERRIDDLPGLLIEFKISSGLTQKEFSQKVGMKEQQLQRYEAEDFKGISFKNLLKILHAIGLEITVKGTVLNKTS